MGKYSVPSGDLEGVNKAYSSEVARVLVAGNLIGGEYVSGFELEFANYLGATHVVSVASGMDALILSLLALNLPKNSKILVSNNAGGYASLAVISAGFEPVYADIEPSGYLLNTDELNKWNGKVSAIIATHLYGKMLNMKFVSKWAEKNSVKVIEDCAQSVGASENGNKAGTLGDVGCFSFYPTKNLGGIGDGGAISTNNTEIAERLRKLANYGWDSRYNIEVRGGRNSRLDAINAAVLSRKLSDLDSNNLVRRGILGRYIAELKKYQFMIDENANESHVAHLASGRVKKPEDFIEFCNKKGVQATRHYPHQDSDQKGLICTELEIDTPYSKSHCAEVVNLPIYPELKDDQVAKVIETVSEWYERAN